jgi:hypothetical protein
MGDETSLTGLQGLKPKFFEDLNVAAEQAAEKIVFLGTGMKAERLRPHARTRRKTRYGV